MPDSSGPQTFSSAMADATNYKRWLVDVFRPYLGGSLLEIGVGDGGFRPLLPAVTDYLGLDVDADLIARARAAHPDAEYLQADVLDPELPRILGRREFDAVLCFNVLEHLQDDAGAVRNLASVLRPGGHLLLLVPALQSLYTDLDRLAGHLRRYTLVGVRSLLPEPIGLVRLYYLNPIGGLGWWLNRFTRHGSLEDVRVHRQVMLFDRLVLPVSRLLTPLTRRLFGQSIVCVARKP